jgi:hypothetical protein
MTFSGIKMIRTHQIYDLAQFKKLSCIDDSHITVIFSVQNELKEAFL